MSDDDPRLDDDERLIAAAEAERSGWMTRVAKARVKPFMRNCVNCGQSFRAPPSSKTRTCSPDCSRRHRSRKHLDKHNRWRSTDAARTAAEHTGNLRLGTPAARKSRKAGSFETNVSAKTWVVIDPAGSKHDATNLRLWCRRNACLFAPQSWQSAYDGLMQVAAWLRGKTLRQASQWRGWTLQDIPAAPAPHAAAPVRS